jgi:hypothetical protein
LTVRRLFVLWWGGKFAVMESFMNHGGAHFTSLLTARDKRRAVKPQTRSKATEIVHLCRTSTRALETTQRAFFPGVKRPERKADHKLDTELS